MIITGGFMNYSINQGDFAFELISINLRNDRDNKLII